MKTFKANYSVSIFKTHIGSYRAEEAEAVFEKISEKKARVIDCSIKNNTSHRQSFDNKFWEAKEIGKIKNISSLRNFEEI